MPDITLGQLWQMHQWLERATDVQEQAARQRKAEARKARQRQAQARRTSSRRR